MLRGLNRDKGPKTDNDCANRGHEEGGKHARRAAALKSTGGLDDHVLLCVYMRKVSEGVTLT